MASTKRAGAALCLHFEELMSVAFAAATALFSFSSQVIVHAAAAFEAAFVSSRGFVLCSRDLQLLRRST